ARRRPARLTGAVRRRPTRRRRPSLRCARAVAPVRRTPSRGRPGDDVAQTAARPGYSGCASLLEACRARPREAPRTPWAHCLIAFDCERVPWNAGDGGTRCHDGRRAKRAGGIVRIAQVAPLYEPV